MRIGLKKASQERSKKLVFLRKTKKETSDVVLKGICETLIAYYLELHKKDVLNLNYNEIKEICSLINHCLDQVDIIGYLKNVSHLARLSFIEGGPEPLPFKGHAAMYIGRALPAPENSLVNLQEYEVYMRFISNEVPYTFNESQGPWNYLYTWCSKATFRPGVGYSESGCLFNSRKKGGQASMLSDIITIFRDNPMESDYEVLKRAAIALEGKYLQHIWECSGCDQTHLHYPFATFSVAEAGYKSRGVTLTSPFLIAFTMPMQQSLLPQMKDDRFLGSAMKGNYTVPKCVSESCKYFSVDFAKATDNFPPELMIRNSLVLEKFCSDVTRTYIRASFSLGRILRFNEQKLKWPGIEFFTKHIMYSRPTPKVADLINKHINIYGNTGYNMLKRRGLKLDDLKREIPKFPEYINYSEDKRKMGMTDIMNKLKAHKHDIRRKVIEYYQKMFEEVKAPLAKSGQHMGLPMSFPSLSAVNGYLVYSTSNNGVIMGDDCVLYGSQEDFDNYCSKAASLGLVINREKTYVSKTRALFCERMFDKGVLVPVTRLKKYCQPNRDDPAIFEDLTSSVLNFRLKSRSEFVRDLLSRGWLYELPCSLYGVSILSPIEDYMDPQSWLEVRNHLEQFFRVFVFNDPSVVKGLLGLRPGGVHKLSDIIMKVLGNRERFQKTFVLSDKVDIDRDLVYYEATFHGGKRLWTSAFVEGLFAKK